MIRVHGEIETPRPLWARGGSVSIAGWCLIEGLPEAPEVRLNTSVGVVPMTARINRQDLAAIHPSETAAARCGFVISGPLTGGVHLAHFEACLPDGMWREFKSLSLTVEEPAFAAAIEAPLASGLVQQREYVEGWALHPRYAAQKLFLRYGHQEISCDPGRSRSDLPALYPESPHATAAGFKSRTILSAGRGALRLKARLSDGSVAIARTPLHVDIPIDEHHDGRIDFAASRVALPVSQPRTLSHSGSKPEQPLNILFVLPGSFAANSALHVAALANELSAGGHSCIVAVSHDLATLAHHADPAFRGVLHTETTTNGVAYPDGRGPAIIHAWTTRENVRQVTESLQARYASKVLVHLEDNEPELLSLSLKRPFQELEKLPSSELDRLVPNDLSHPHRSRAFLARADGITVITDRLAEFAPAGRPIHLLWPAADARYFQPLPPADTFRRVLNRTANETVIFYHGNVHAANAAEVRELYAAVLQLNRAGEPVTLIRTGLDAADFLGSLADEVVPHVLSLGQIHHHHHLPPLMALADIFVQPGKSDAFNDYRFPSKLPEFFAIGRPVILPRTNLGLLVRHGIDAYVIDQADATGIGIAITTLRHDPALCERLSQGAITFAKEHFSWRRSAEALAKFYQTLAPS